MHVELRELSIKDGNDIYDMLKEIGPGENGFMNGAYVLSREEFPGFLEQNLRHSQCIDLPQGYVPQTIYWLYIDSRPVGMGKLRHYLNDALRVHGGHIGYCIRPAERGKGYGTMILGVLLDKAREKGVDEALLTCNADNIPSRRVIQGNNGKLEIVENGECKYCIKL